MPALAYVQALEEIEHHARKHRFYLLLTESDFAQREVCRLLLDAVVPSHRDFNVSRLNCTKETSAAEVTALAEELPIMQERRLLWVSQAHLMSDAQALRLAAYLPEAPETTWMFFSATPSLRSPASVDDDETTSGPVSGLKRLTEFVKKQGLVVQAGMKPNEVLAWMKRDVARRGLSASDTTCAALRDRVGDDLTALSSELDKLGCYVAERAHIDVEDIDRLVRGTAQRRIFDLSDAMARRDTTEALRVLTDLLNADEPPLRILAYLSTHYRGLIKLKAMQTARASRARMAEVTGKKEWNVDKDLRLLERLPAGELDGAVEAMIRADQGIKSGKDAILLLQLLIIHLCRNARKN